MPAYLAEVSMAKVTSGRKRALTRIPPPPFSARGIPRFIYGMSKVFENAYTKVVARECKAYTNMEVNAVCPG